MLAPSASINSLASPPYLSTRDGIDQLSGIVLCRRGIGFSTFGERGGLRAFDDLFAAAGINPLAGDVRARSETHSSPDPVRQA